MWPGLNSKWIKKHLQPSLATAQGHLWQDIRGEIFIKHQCNPSLPLASLISCTDELLELFSASNDLNLHTYNIIFSLVEYTPDNKASSDITGCFTF